MMRYNRISIFRNPARRATEVYFYQRTPDGKTIHATSLQLEEVKEYDDSPPIFYLDDEGATALLQELWDQGYRPHNYEGGDTIAAVRSHLDDMRRIAYKFLEKV